MKLPADAKGSAVMAVYECEGHESRFAVDVSDGRAMVTASDATPDVRLRRPRLGRRRHRRRVGDDAVRWGLAEGTAGVLDVLSRGPAPFCNEYF